MSEAPPKGMRVVAHAEREGYGPQADLELVFRWNGPATLHMAGFASVWIASVGVPFYLGYSGILDMEGIMVGMLGFFLLAGLFLVHSALALLVNRTTIFIGDGAFWTVSGPLGKKETPHYRLDDIDKFEVFLSGDENTAARTHTIQAHFKAGGIREVVTHLPTLAHAEYAVAAIERAIEG